MQWLISDIDLPGTESHFDWIIGQGHPSNPEAAANGFMLLSWDCIIKLNKKLGGPAVNYTGSNEPSRESKFEWPDNTFNANVNKIKTEYKRDCLQLTLSSWVVAGQ